MPFEVMDQRVSTASFRPFDEIPLPAERQIGFLKSQTMSGCQDGLSGTPVGKLTAESALEKLSPSGPSFVDDMDVPQSNLVGNQKEKLPVGEGSTKVFKNSMDQHANSQSSLSPHPGSYSFDRDKSCLSGIQWESTLFSSSMSELFSRKMRLHVNDAKSRHSGLLFSSFQKEEEHLESLEEIEAQTIGNLLPAEDDLFSGVTDVLGFASHANGGDDLEDFDLFSSSGGLELEGDELLPIGKKYSDISGIGFNGQEFSRNSVLGENPSRTLFVRNISSNVEDSELMVLFQKYGDVRTLYTACKHRGFVMISYYDIRAAQNAMKSLQNKPLKHRNLDIHYSIPKENPPEKDVNQGSLVVFNLDPSVSIDELGQIFGAYGEIKEIHETMHGSHQKFIEYYDMRSAEAAISALDRSIIAGKQIKLEFCRLGGARSSAQQSEQEADESNLCQSPYGGLTSGRMGYSPGVIGSSYKDNGSGQILHSTLQSPAGGFIEPSRGSSVPNNLPSPVNVVYVGKQFGLAEPNRSLSELKLVNHGAPNFHPHSFPEYHDNLANGIPYNSTSAVGGMASSVGPNMANGIANRNIGGVGSNGHPMERSGQVFGSSLNGGGTLPGNNYMWNNSSSGQQHHSTRLIWPNSMSYANGVRPHHFPHMPGFPRAHSVMLNTAPAHHHVGSAPTVNPSMLDRRHTFAGESPEASSFHLGSLGTVGLPGSSPTHPIEIAPRNIFYNAGGMDMTKNPGFCSPQQMSHIFTGRNQMIPMPSSFDSPNERVRSMSHRRNEANSSNENKKQYELDIDRILRGEDGRTTLMIKNIPNKYTSKMLLAAIDEHCRGTYDFIYLPIDFKNKCNVGYAFINMIDAQQIIPFYKAFNGKKWEKFNSEKVASLAYARIQGKAALIAHFQNSSLMNEDKRCRPILFHTDGPNAGDPEPFPMGTNIRSRLGKPRTTSNNEDNNLHSSPSSFVNGEDTCNGMDSASGSD